MNIAWITVKRKRDLSYTTTKALAKEIVNSSHDLTILGPDPEEEQADTAWRYVSLVSSSIKGFKSRSIAKSAANWLKNDENQKFDVIILDWAVAPLVVLLCKDTKSRFVLMDRSPPADVGILGRLQWREWNKAWTQVAKGNILYGMVTSRMHADFVHRRHGVSLSKMPVVPAGVDLDLFKSQPQDDSEDLRLVYHGRLDKHRGVFSLPMLCQKISGAGTAVTLTLIGEGDAVPRLKRISEHAEWMSVLDTMPQRSLAAILAEQHIGLLPMPEHNVWSIASPLKRSEYLASGLLILGIDHAGHRLDDMSDEWCGLFPQASFFENAIDWIEFAIDDLARRKELARAYAESHSSWKSSFRSMETMFQSFNIEP